METTRISTDLLPGEYRPCTYSNPRYEIIDIDSEVEYWNEQGENITADNIEINREGYKKDLYSDLIVFYSGVFNDYINEVIGKPTIKISEKKDDKVLHSPQYYNYSTDWINMDLEYSIENLLEHAEQYKDYFDHFLRENYTSGHGFMSRTPDNYKDRQEAIKDLDHNEHGQAIGAILSFVLRDSQGLEYTFYEACYNMDTIYQNIYIDKGENQLQGVQ